MSNLLNDWNKIFDENISKNIIPRKYIDKILLVDSKSPSWRFEIQLQKESLIEQINNYYGNEIIKEIKIK